MRRWALWGLAAYAAAVGVVLLSPVSPGAAVEMVSAWVQGTLGLSWVRQGWIEFGANIVLFLPLGFLLTALWRRQWIGFVVALVVSAGAEIAQLALPARTAAPRDVLANVSGALIGGAIAWLLLHRRRPRSRSSAGRR
jgi:hypothetical protein